MFKKNFNLFLFFLIVILVTTSLVQSAPPVTQIQEFAEGFIIEGSPQEYLTQNQDYQYNFFVFNISNGVKVTNTSVSCIFYLADDSGAVIYYSHVPYNSPGYFGLTISGGNFSRLGHYGYGTNCNSSIMGGSTVSFFEVSPSGYEATTGRAIIDIGLLLMLLCFFIIVICLFISFDNLLNRVGMIGLGYLLLIAMTFIGWQLANDFLLSAPFIVIFLRLLFIILIICALPLFMGAIAWYFLMLFKIKEIERLMGKGMSYNDAERRQRRKYR